jgi:hypothetical protein
MSGDNQQLDLLNRHAKPRGQFQLVTKTEREHVLQVDCTSMLNLILLPSVTWTAIDHAHSLNMALGRNGRPIGFSEVAKRKARGVKAGIADYLFWHRGRGFAIELKRDADADLSDDQETFLSSLIANDVEVSIAWTIDQVAERVRFWNLCRHFTVT